MLEIKSRHVWSYIWRSVKPFPLPLFIMFLVAVVWAVDLSVKPYLLKTILNRLAEGSQADVFTYLAGPVILYLFLYFALSSSFRAYGYFVEINMIPRMREKIANDAFGRLLGKSHAYYQNNFSGSLTNKVQDLTGDIPDLLQSMIDRFFSHFIALAIAIFTLWQVSAIFAVAMGIWTTLFIRPSAKV